VSPAKTAEPIEMPFGLWVWMGPRNQVLDVDPELLRDIAMAISFGMQFARSGLVRTIATRRLVMEEVGFEWSADKMQILLTTCNYHRL